MTSPRLFAKRPSTVEAWEWDGTPECADLIVDWIIENGGPLAYLHPHEPLIILGDDIAPVVANDWVVRDKFGEFWPLAGDVFPAVYRSLVE